MFFVITVVFVSLQFFFVCHLREKNDRMGCELGCVSGIKSQEPKDRTDNQNSRRDAVCGPATLASGLSCRRLFLFFSPLAFSPMAGSCGSHAKASPNLEYVKQYFKIATRLPKDTVLCNECHVTHTRPNLAFLLFGYYAHHAVAILWLAVCLERGTKLLLRQAHCM
jgi:hypothetical protein